MKRAVRRAGCVLGWALVAHAASTARAEVFLSELLYNSPHGDENEYVELHNTGAGAADLSGWSLGDGVRFKFPEGASIAPGGYLVVAHNRDALRAAYPGLSAELILGDFEGSLANEGETVSLAAADGSPRDEVTYGDDSPWDFLADGFGASLERICFSASAGAPEAWHASAVPSSLEAFGGSPGAANGISLCPPVAPARPRVHISEIMYHPVLEESLEDEHEFIEIQSAEPAAVSLAGWRLAGGIDFTFPETASIGPGERVVIAKNRALLAAVASYGLAEGSILGDYARALDNGGDKVALIGRDGQGIESVTYEDDAPWPAAADAFGASEEWLRPELLPLEPHRYQGFSLERVSLDVPAGELSNWVPSPLDGATPGRVNASARAEPLPVVSGLHVQPLDGSGPLIRSDKQVFLQVSFTPHKPSGAVELDYFLDDVIQAAAGAVATLPMSDDGSGGGDLLAGDGVYSATLPGQPDNSVVRYRVRADRGAGLEQVSPRPTDPNPWNAYFVSPVIDSTTATYQVLVSLQNWGRMWTGIQAGRASGCNASATWDQQVPAVFIHEGRVHDVRVRYQGSRWNRTNGPNMANWPFPRPTGGPNPLRALSWRIEFPRYDQFDGSQVVTLNKLTQGCPGYNAGVGYRIFEMADLPGSQTRFVRFHVNGGYYHYMIQLEHPDDAMMRRYHADMAKKYPERPKEKVGHVYKSAGYNGDEGPWGWGDERALAPTCKYTKEDRYAATYDRKTHSWDTYAELIRVIEELGAARRQGTDAMRAFLEENFDMELLLNYVAITNYSVPFDDMFQNHFLYQRLSDHKWFVFPWDIDQNYGEWKPASASLYMGEQGDPDNRSGWWNYLKDTVLKSYRKEYEDRLFLLNNTILHPDSIQKLIDAVTLQANPAEASRAPAGISCSFPGRATSFRTFAVTRHALVNTKVAGVEINAGPDQTVFVGSTVQFDARETLPDPGPDVPYKWDNGMTGDLPTFVFADPGVYPVMLTLEVRGVPFRDEVKITVLAPPDRAFRESGGQVVMEAESFSMNERNGAENTFWEAASAAPGFSGAGYTVATETRRQTFLQRYAGFAPELRYAVLFQTPGVYRVWIRALSTTSSADSVYMGIGGAERNTRFATQFQVDEAAYLWSGDTRSAGPQQIEVLVPGLQIISVWVRESGQIIDKLVLSTAADFTPEGAGPPESDRLPIGPEGSFVRGDVDASSRLNVTDAIYVISHLFGSLPIPCEDRADFDDSGTIEIADAVSLLRYLFQHGPAPGAPFPGPGLDSTPDDLNCAGL